MPSVGETVSERLETAIEAGRAAGRLALYFGCWNRPGHFLWFPNGLAARSGDKAIGKLPWNDALMDTGLLRNGKHLDNPDGRVWWTCGGLEFWYAFLWWDRAGDSRGNSNSGFYVRGFGWPEAPAAFTYACEQFPAIVSRQRHPLVLQER